MEHNNSHRKRQGADTRKQLVRVAEQLFAEQGVDAVSIRAINAAAEVGAASIHYHFGSREGLLKAVIDEHGAWVSEQISARVSELADGRAAPTATALVEAIAVPYERLIERDPTRGSRWVKIIAQLAMSQDEALGQMFPGPSSAIHAQLQRAFPHVEEDRLRLRWLVATRTLIQMLSHAGRWTATGGGGLRTYVAELVDFVAGGLEAVGAHARLPAQAA